ncbi:MAG TPA: EpsD family peptidyl-prolyl cis-trans isomerase [Caldimonas sp.]|nr:EpsD family peptidyl-prolyl cis-trans isomerase [Caldimonas sp.]
MSLRLSSHIDRGPRLLAWAAALALGLALTACNRNKDAAGASQTAAKVNKEEITVHQINYFLSQQRALPPAQAASAGKLVLERLIDQELEVQKATDQKLDRDPRVVQALEAARRDVIARAYLDKVAQGAPKPTPAEIKAYYDEHPALFAKRRVYTFREVAVVAAPAQVDTLRSKLDAAKNLPEFVSYLKANDFRYAENEVTRAAEQLPLTNVERIAAMKDGESLFTPTPNGAVVLYLASSRTDPVDEQRAAPAIEQFLLNERRRKLIEDDRRALRNNAKIEYVGAYAGGPGKALPPEPVASAPELPRTSIAPPLDPAASAAPVLEVAPPPVQATSMPSRATLDKGLQGMK